MDLYAYVGNDPLNGADPSGRSLLEIGFVIADVAQLAADVHSGANGWQIAGDVAFTAFDVASTAAPVPGLSEGAHAIDAGVHLAEAAHAAEGAEHAAQAGEHVHTCCFVAGTLVDTSTGLRPIDQIGVGDRVLSRNPDTGETAYKPVTGLIHRHDREIYAVTLVTTSDDGHEHISTFETTDDHPWRTEDGHWRTTLELQPGMTLVRAHGTARVLRVGDEHRTARTYNLQVADFHTYFVGDEHVWVHNACPITGTPQRTVRGGVETTHGSTSARIAAERAETPGAAVVTQNQTLRTATGGEINSSLRGDATTVVRDANGNITRVHVDEVLSPGQTAEGQAAHYESVDPRITVQSHNPD
jgi:hypothetical protein